jgi:starch-binding outer membrane protein SusE/F
MIMRKNIFILSAVLGIAALVSCEKEGEKTTLLANPVAPTLATLPNLTLERANFDNTLEFVGTPVDPGFTASANYYLEACMSGTNFADPVVLYSGKQDTSIKLTVGDLNGLFLSKFNADTVSTTDFRIRAVLTLSGSSITEPFEYISSLKTADITIYGLPRLDLIGSGLNQKIESPAGDGIYSGFVKLDEAMPFTLKDPDTETAYGFNAGALEVDGAALTVTNGNGYYKLSADIGGMTYSIGAYKIGLVGDATPNGWNVPDQKMEYNSKLGTWNITIDLVNGKIKFRKNDDWGWNLGGTADNLTQGGSDIPVTAGNYTISLKIINDATGTCTIVKND